MSLIGGAGWRLFLNERDSDVCVRVEWAGRGWRFPGHSLVLAAMSDVIRAMLDHDMKEKTDKTITIRDADPVAVKQLLKYLYTGIVELGEWRDCVSLVSLAHQYMVPPLVRILEGHLVGQLNLSNCVVLHEAARTYGMEDLLSASGNLLRESLFVVCGREDFCQMSATSLHALLANHRTNAESEEAILDALRTWARDDCAKRCLPLTQINIQRSQEPFLRHIRWNNVPRALHPSTLPISLQIPRLPFRVTPLLQPHLHLLKFVVELGVFQERLSGECLRFSVDSHAFILGFRIVGLFEQKGRSPFIGSSSLYLMRDDRHGIVQFNLNSLAWTRGSSSSKDTIWRELIAFLPTPIRVDPFAEYAFMLRTKTTVMWPKTRFEGGSLTTCLGSLKVKTKDPNYGVTQLFLLPAPTPQVGKPREIDV